MKRTMFWPWLFERDEGQAPTFWADAFSIQGSAARQILGRVMFFTTFAFVVWYVDLKTPEYISLKVGVAPYEVAGAALGALLVLRTNAGYERWWEGRKLWGAIVNQSRALATTALAYGPTDPGWSDRLVRWTAAYGHATRRSLRGQRDLPELVTLLGSESAEKVAKARHMPTFVSIEIAALLRIAYEQHGMDRLAFAQAESARCSLLDQTGGCERILKSPLPRAYGINIRRFILLFLITLPFSILDAVGWLTPVVAFLVAYPIMSLDEIGVELQNPFIVRNLGHLPLDEICATIEKDLLAIGSDRV